MTHKHGEDEAKCVGSDGDLLEVVSPSAEGHISVPAEVPCFRTAREVPPLQLLVQGQFDDGDCVPPEGCVLPVVPQLVKPFMKFFCFCFSHNVLFSVKRKCGCNATGQLLPAVSTSFVSLPT